MTIPKWRTRAGSVLALALVLFGVHFLRRSTANLIGMGRRVTHTHEVIQRLEFVAANLTRAESAARGYKISADDRIRLSYVAGSTSALSDLRAVRALVADNPDQQRRVEALDPLVRRRLAILDGLFGNGGEKAAAHPPKEGREIMRRIDSLIAEMIAQERLLLERRAADLDASYEREVTVEAALSLAACAILLSVFILLERETARREQAVAELRKQRDLLNAVFEGADSSIYLKDLECRFIMLNSTTARGLGLTAEQLIGKSVAEFLPPEEAREIEETDRAVLRTGRPMTDEITVSYASEKRTYLISKTPFRDSAGAVIGVVGVARDVTEHRRAEERVREARSFLESVVENIPAMLFIKDAATLRFNRFNRAGEELLGIDRKDILEKSDYDLFPKEQAEFFMRKDREVLAGRAVLDIPEESIQTRAKGRRTLHTRKIPIIGPDGVPTHLLGISEDVTLRKIAEDKILEAARMKTEFAAMVSHELRTPLAAIKMAIDMTLGGVAGTVSSEQSRLLSKAQSNLDRLARLVTEVLDFEKLETGRMQFDPRACDLDAVLTEVVETFAPVAKSKGLALVVRPHGGLGGVVCDKDKITQVLVNFVNNAMKFSARGTVTVASTLEQGAARVSVRDEGPGISAEDQAKLFNSFVQLANGPKKTEGAGLGLAICRRIIESHGGRIGVESSPGHGASFYFTLPLEKGV